MFYNLITNIIDIVNFAIPIKSKSKRKKEKWEEENF